MARMKHIAIAAGLIVTALPATALAQQVPAEPDPDGREIGTGTRLPTITVIGAIRDPRAPKQAEQPADTSIPELPVVYEEDGAKPGN